MLKRIALACSLLLAGAVMLFVPIHPAILQAVGLGGAQPTSPAKTENRGTGFQHTSLYETRGESRDERRASRPAASASDSRGPLQQMLPIAAAPISRFNLAPDIARKPAETPAGNIAEELQAELRRVGCYHGRVDGDWGPASRYAMAAFNKAVNATLPTDRADVILLALVRRHAGDACGAGARTVTATAPGTQSEPRQNGNLGWIARVLPSRPAAGSQIAARRAAGRHEAPSTATPSGSVPFVTPPLLAQPNLVPRLTGAPRIVSADGKRSGPIAGRAQQQTVPTAASGAGVGAAAQPANPLYYAGGRMALGAQPAADATDRLLQAPAPVTAPLVREDWRDGTGDGARDRDRTYRPAARSREFRSRRAERPSRQGRPKRRGRSRAWRSKVYSAVNLNGQ